MALHRNWGGKINVDFSRPRYKNV